MISEIWLKIIMWIKNNLEFRIWNVKKMQSLNILFIDKIRNNTFFIMVLSFTIGCMHIHIFIHFISIWVKQDKEVYVCLFWCTRYKTLNIIHKKITTLGLRGNLVRPTSGQPHKNHQLDFCVVSMKFLFGIFPLLKVHVFHISRKRGR